MNTVTIPVTIANETREIEFEFYGEQGTSKDVVAVRIGRGTKLHRASLSAVCDSFENLKRFGYGSKDIVEIDGQFYAVKKTATVRNSNAQVNNWADNVAGTNAATAQTYYGSL